MDTARFQADLRLIPASLRTLAEALPAPARPTRSGRVLILAMGSSKYAADAVARRARMQGLPAVAEWASAEQLPAPASDLTVVAVSATGGSVEVLAAAQRYTHTGRLIAVTNRHDSELAALADRVVLLHAGVEASGVACRTFRHTFPVLELLLAEWGYEPPVPPADAARAAADGNEALLTSSDGWLPEVADLLAGPMGTWTLAPVERLSSAQQSALMLREVPRRPAYASETGDWSHVDVYLTKTQDYRALVYAGSRWDAQALNWMRERGSTWVSVGAPLPGAAATVRYPRDGDADVAPLVELLVAELVAAHWLDASA